MGIRIRKISDGERRSCLGKIKHNSTLAAQNHLDELRVIAKTPHLLDYYKCQYCDGYHCGNNREE